MFTFSFVLQQSGHDQICPLVVMVMWFAWVIWREFFSQESTPEGNTDTHKSSFFPYKQIGGRNGDHEWLRMTNAFILCDLLWKVQKRHAANRVGSFNIAISFGNGPFLCSICRRPMAPHYPNHCRYDCIL